VDQSKDGRISVGVSAIVRVTLKNGCYHEVRREHSRAEHVKTTS